MKSLLDLICVPPEMPPLEVSLPSRIVAAIMTWAHGACELFYYAGLRDGFVLGVLIAIMFTAPRASTGASNVKNR